MRGKLNLRAQRVRKGFILTAGLFFCLHTVLVQAQESRPATADEVRAGKTSQGGAVFKIPKGYMSADFATFKGVLIIDPKKPAGMFVAYPNDGETTDSLRQRARAAIVKMFIHNKDVPETAWQIKSLPSHAGDSTASVATYANGEDEVQVATYERTEGSYLLVYGYFAMRQISGKGENGRFLDEQGQGVKDFDKLWQSFGGKKK
jgi:hypothetical protein